MNLSQSAKAAMDDIGWADYSKPEDLAAACMELARVVMAQAAAIERLEQSNALLVATVFASPEIPVDQQSML